jgi:7-cyano-7-deazaguanine synthase
VNKKVAVLMSGGMDSAVLVASYLEKGFAVQPVYVRAGLRWESVELGWARRYLAALSGGRLRPLRTLSLDAREFMPPGHFAFGGKVPGSSAPWDSIYLPGRNLLLLSKASVLAAESGIGRVAMATLSGNPFPDARPAFFEAMARAASLALGRPISVETPFRTVPKERLISRWRTLPLHLTFSCIRPAGRKHCGRCTKCFERRRAFERAGVPDRTSYAS